MIKFLDLEKINNRFRSEIDRRISSILDRDGICKVQKMRNFVKILRIIAAQNIVSA